MFMYLRLSLTLKLTLGSDVGLDLDFDMDLDSNGVQKTPARTLTIAYITSTPIE